MSHQLNTLYEFGPFRLDVSERLLLREGKAVPLTPKSFDLLLALVERPGHLLEKAELMRLLWPDTFVEEANLTWYISAIRKALGDGENEQPYIETAPRRGYRFVGKVIRGSNQGGGLVSPSQTESNVANTASVAGFAELGDIPEALHASSQYRPVNRHRKGLTLSLAVSIIILGGIAWGIYQLGVKNPTRLNGSSFEQRVVPITSLEGYETQASFSPDGNQVAFVRNGDIYLTVVSGGDQLRLTSDPATETSPVWSPDGRYLAFIREGEESGVYLIPALGGPQRKLAETSSPEPVDYKSSLSYSPDGKFIAVTDKLAGEPFSIFSLSLETGAKHRLTFPPSGSLGDGSPAVSPDGQRLAFTRMPSPDVSDLYVAPLRGGEPMRLTYQNANTFGLTWTSDGRSIVFSSRGKSGFIPHLWRISTSGGTPERVAVFAQDLHHPTISRQGNQLAFSQSIFDVNIWRIGLKGSAAKDRLPTKVVYSTVIFETSPEYSPDGTKITFTSSRAGMPEIWVCDSSGENQFQLTNLSSSLTGTPSWSPDGRQIAFESLLEGNKDIYLISANGGKPRRLTVEPSEELSPSWSRNGQWIYFSSNRNAGFQIWKMSAAGGPAVQVTKGGGFEGFESPDEKFFYFTKGIGIPGIWRVPLEGGDESLVLSRHKAGSCRYWRVVDQGIYFAALTPRPVIEFFSFKTGEVIQIAALDKKIQTHYRGLSVSPDGLSITYASVDNSGSDIMLMENFR